MLAGETSLPKGDRARDRVIRDYESIRRRLSSVTQGVVVVARDNCLLQNNAKLVEASFDRLNRLLQGLLIRLLLCMGVCSFMSEARGFQCLGSEHQLLLAGLMLCLAVATSQEVQIIHGCQIQDGQEPEP